jgi:hypothetical protein
MPERLAEGASLAKIEGDDAAPQIDRTTRTSCHTRGAVLCRHRLRSRMRRPVRHAEPTTRERDTFAVAQRTSEHRSVRDPHGYA